MLGHVTSSRVPRILGQKCLRRWLHDTSSTRKIDSIAALVHASNGIDTTAVQVNGYINSLRRQKKIVFATLRDGSTTTHLQAVLDPAKASRLSIGAAVQLSGRWRGCPPGLKQTHELHVDNVQLLGENDITTNPIQNKYQTAQYLRTIPHLRSRVPFNSLLLRLRSQVIGSVTDYFARNDFIQTHTPIITSSDCEGAGEVFTVTVNDPNVPSAGQANEPFFRSHKYMTVSAQLHLEALAQSVGRVWTLSPTFRAEKSDTPRHLSEFYMLEAELCFVQNMDQVMNVVEDMLRHVAGKLQSSLVGRQLAEHASISKNVHDENSSVNGEDLQKRWAGLALPAWPRITYDKAIKLLVDASAEDASLFEMRPSYENGLQAEHERWLANHMGRDGSPVFITNYPRLQKPFYMARSMGTGTDTVACFDLLVPDLCELVGGSMREHRSAELLAAMRENGVTGKDDIGGGGSNVKDMGTLEHEHQLQWYVDLRRYGSVPHGGFGLGFDRLLCYLSGVSNIRDVVAFPRWYGRCHA